jgi:hypothetical protein
MIHFCWDEAAAIMALLTGGPGLMLWVKAKLHARFCCRHKKEDDHGHDHRP